MDRWHDASSSDEAWQAYVAELKEDFETGLETPETLLKEGVDWNETDERARWTEFEERDAEARRAQLTYWTALDAAEAERVALARAEAESQFLALEEMREQEEADWAEKEDTLHHADALAQFYRDEEVSAEMGWGEYESAVPSCA